MADTYTFQVNGNSTTTGALGTTPLLYVLRNDLGLKSARFGCGQGDCGACTVILDGKPVQSCDVSVEFAAGKNIETVESLCNDGERHPIQQAMIDEQAGQCGFCMTGIIMSAKALLENNPNPTRIEITTALDGHLCRCGSHPRILKAVAKAAQKMAENVK